MRLRPYMAEDFPQLYELEKQCFQPPQRFSRRLMQTLLSNANAATWIAELEDGSQSTMIGFALVEWSCEADEVMAYLETIEVLCEHRRTGAGSALLERVIQSAQQAGSTLLWLHVEATNQAALQLYQRHRFTEAGEEQHYYGRNRNARVLLLKLKPDSTGS